MMPQSFFRSTVVQSWYCMMGIHFNSEVERVSRCFLSAEKPLPRIRCWRKGLPCLQRQKKTHTVSGRQIFLKKTVHFIQPYHKYRKFGITNLWNSMVKTAKHITRHQTFFGTEIAPLNTAGGHKLGFPKAKRIQWRFRSHWDAKLGWGDGS